MWLSGIWESGHLGIAENAFVRRCFSVRPADHDQLSCSISSRIKMSGKLSDRFAALQGTAGPHKAVKTSGADGRLSARLGTQKNARAATAQTKRGLTPQKNNNQTQKNAPRAKGVPGRGKEPLFLNFAHFSPLSPYLCRLSGSPGRGWACPYSPFKVPCLPNLYLLFQPSLMPPTNPRSQPTGPRRSARREQRLREARPRATARRPRRSRPPPRTWTRRWTHTGSPRAKGRTPRC